MMSKQEAGINLLNLLSKQFKAKISGRSLADIYPKKDSPSLTLLWEKGILSVIGSPDRVPCPLGEHDDDGMVLADKHADGFYKGFCPEHRKDISVPSSECEWIEFNPVKWVEAVQSMNGIEGDMVFDSSGHCFLGVFKTATLKLGVTVISANAFGHVKSIHPAGRQPALNMWIYLNDRVPNGINGEGVRLKASDLFKESPVKFDKQAIAKALASLPAINKSDNGIVYEKYSHISRSMAGLTLAQYQADTKIKNIKGFDLFIDLTRHQAWIRGKEIKHMTTRNEKGKFKPLSKRGLDLIASFIKVPFTRHVPIQMGPYAGSQDGRDADSAAKMMANIRRALNLQQIIKTYDGRGGIRGDSSYSFEPGDKFTYALIEPIVL